MSEHKQWRSLSRMMTIRIVFIYALVSTLWIFTSDQFIHYSVTSPEIKHILAIGKGLLFVLVTSALLYILVRNHLKTMMANQREIYISDEKFRTIYNSVSDAIFIHDVQTGKIIDVNETMLQMYECRREDFMRVKPEVFCEGIPPYSDKEAYEYVRKAAAGIPQNFEWHARTYTGRLFWIDVKIRKAQIDKDERLIVTVRDIDERKKAEQALHELERRQLLTAQAANAAKDELLAMVSHELRTPLTPVLLILSALQNSPNLDPTVREDITLACRHVEMESRLIDDLLDLTRIMSRKLSLHQSPCRIQEVITAAVGVCTPQLKDKNLHLECQFHDTNGEMSADSGRLQQVLWNLLGNAIKFTQPGGTITVITRTEPDQSLSIRIRDTGIGMAPETLSRIFTMFVQADRTTTRKYGGLGIGLAICKAIVELHQGTITAESPGIGQGTTITIKLPNLAA